MKKVLAVAAAGFAASGAAAAPFSYDCDTAAGSYSQIAQAQAGPRYRVAGQIAARQLRKHETWAPMATIRLGSGDSKTFVSLQLAGLSGEPNLVVFLVTHRSGVEDKKPLGSVRVNEVLPFELSAEGSRVRARLGSFQGEVDAAIGAKGKVSVSCSTGEFEFPELDLGPAG